MGCGLAHPAFLEAGHRVVRGRQSYNTASRENPDAEFFYLFIFYEGDHEEDRL
jgi:hypothetical protein